jgi:hypothetical protein
LLHAAIKIDAHGAVGKARAGGDFGAGHAFDEAKDERFAVGVWERADGFEDGVGFGAGVGGMIRGRGERFGLRGGRSFVEFFVGFDAAVKIRGAIARDGGEPSGKAGDFAKGSETWQGLEEDVLDEIVNIGEGNASEENAVNHAGVASVEKAEGGAVAALGGANEGVVGASARFMRRIHGRRIGVGRADFRECGHVGSMKKKSVSQGRRRETAEC